MRALLLCAVGCFFVHNQVANGDFVLGEAIRVPNVNSSSDEGPPDISADGLELYFKSNRHHGADMCFSDIWLSRRTSKHEPWNTPMNLGLPISSSFPEAEPCISSDGLELYFGDGFPGWYAGCAPRPEGYGNGDLWVSTRNTRQEDWSTPVNLGLEVNSSSWEDCPSISPDGLSLFFCSDRPGGYGMSDLYVTTRQTKAEPWGRPVNLGAMVNRLKWQTCSEISPDGLLLFFSAGTTQIDIFLSRRITTAHSWGVPVSLGAAVNTPKDDYGPAFSADCSVFYFTRGEIVHLQPSPNLATYDIWQAEILPIVDFNNDGKVDVKDIIVMTENWGRDYPLCDIGPTPFGDGVVDVRDLLVLAEHMEPEVREPGLIAHWKLDETEGATAYDSAGFSDGALVGDPLWQPDAGPIDGALEFDGMDDSVVADFVLDPREGPFSVFTWIKGGAPGQVIVSQVDGENWLMADASEGTLATELVPPPGRTPVPPLVSDTVITDDNWHRVGFVWNGTSRALYVDDILVAESEEDGLTGSAGGVLIGCGGTMAPATLWSGLIDDVRVYNRGIRP